jgi:hypothetical protein
MNEYDENFDDYTEEGVEEIDFDVENDAMLERQEMEDFAQDGYFENMEPMEDGFWG